MQIDLLRVLEEKQITRLGSREPIKVDFRLISATRRNLAAAIAGESFREDFFYRINVIHIPVPPLRAHKDDIPLLIDHFLNKYSQEMSKRVDRISVEAMQLLKQYHWPGNIRELENAIERAVVLSRSRTLRTSDFAFLKLALTPTSGSQALRDMEVSHILKVLDENDWNITRSSAVLGINRVTLHKKIKRLGLQKPSP